MIATKIKTAFIPMSEALARKQGLYVLTTQAEQLIVPGVASLILANFLVRGLPSESAWDVATSMKPGEHILKVDFLELADTPNRKEAERVLESTVGAEILA